MKSLIAFIQSIFFTTDPDSKQFSWNLKDFWRGLVVAVFTPVATILYQTIEAWTASTSADFALIIDWKSIVKVAVGSFMAYMMKNFFTRSK